MKRAKRIGCLLVALGLLASVFSACGTAEAPSAAPTEPSAAETAAAAPETAAPAPAEPAEQEEPEGSTVEETVEEPAIPEPEPFELPIVDEPETLTLWTRTEPFTIAYPEIDINNVTFYKEMEARTGVHVDITGVIAFQADEQFNLMVAGGDYTDIIGVMNYYGSSSGASAGSAGHEKAIEDGIIIDLYDDLKEYAPNYWNILTSDDNAYMTMRTQSGYMGCIAQLLKKAGTENQGMIVRKD